MRETKDSEERRQEFVDVAEKLFKKNGIVDTTVNNIVKELDVAKGLFYYYFKSKDDVIDAISKKYNEAFRDSMTKSMDEEDWPLRLHQFLDNCIVSFRTMYVRLQGDGDVDLSQLTMVTIEEARADSSEALEKLLAEGVEKHYIDVKDTTYAADFIIGGIAYLVSRGETDRVLIGDLVYNSLLKKDGKE